MTTRFRLLVFPADLAGIRPTAHRDGANPGQNQGARGVRGLGGMAAAGDCQGQGHVRGARAGRGASPPSRTSPPWLARWAGSSRISGARPSTSSGAAAEARCRGHRGQYAGSRRPTSRCGMVTRADSPIRTWPTSRGRSATPCSTGDPHRHAQCAAAARRGPQGRPLQEMASPTWATSWRRQACAAEIVEPYALGVDEGGVRTRQP